MEFAAEQLTAGVVAGAATMTAAAVARAAAVASRSDHAHDLPDLVKSLKRQNKMGQVFQQHGNSIGETWLTEGLFNLVWPQSPKTMSWLESGESCKGASGESCPGDIPSGESCKGASHREENSGGESCPGSQGLKPQPSRRWTEMVEEEEEEAMEDFVFDQNTLPVPKQVVQFQEKVEEVPHPGWRELPRARPRAYLWEAGDAAHETLQARASRPRPGQAASSGSFRPGQAASSGSFRPGQAASSGSSRPGLPRGPETGGSGCQPGPHMERNKRKKEKKLKKEQEQVDDFNYQTNMGSPPMLVAPPMWTCSD